MTRAKLAAAEQARRCRTGKNEPSSRPVCAAVKPSSAAISGINCGRVSRVSMNDSDVLPSNPHILTRTGAIALIGTRVRVCALSPGVSARARA